MSGLGEVDQLGWQIIDGVELVAPRAVATLHRAVDLGALGRQHEELDSGFGFGRRPRTRP